MIDVVYILGRGTQWEDNELRYSLRSIEKCLLDYGRVWIIGYRPDFVSDLVTVIHHDDVHQNKARNLMEKIREACHVPQIADNFMLFNDDYFLLKQFSAVNYPYYYKGDLADLIDNLLPGEWQKHCKYTHDILKANHRATLDFDTHKPIVYNKKLFVQMVENYNWDIEAGYIAKSMYCNHHRIPGIYEPDCKITKQFALDKIQEYIAHRQMFSIGERALTDVMKEFLAKHYPNKSKFEF